MKRRTDRRPARKILCRRELAATHGGQQEELVVVAEIGTELTARKVTDVTLKRG